MTTLIIDIEKTDIQALSKKLKATYAQSVEAFRFAAKSVLTYTRKALADDLQQELPLLKRGILKRTVLKFERQGNRAGSFFIGLNPVDLIYATPKPKQTAQGVSGGGQTFAHGFLINKNGKTQAVRRKGKARLPLETLRVDIAQKATPFINNYFEELVPVFLDTFYQNLNRRINLQ